MHEDKMQDARNCAKQFSMTDCGSWPESIQRCGAELPLAADVGRPYFFAAL
jgi:hypothetical protein